MNDFKFLNTKPVSLKFTLAQFEGLRVAIQTTVEGLRQEVVFPDFPASWMQKLIVSVLADLSRRMAEKQVFFDTKKVQYKLTHQESLAFLLVFCATQIQDKLNIEQMWGIQAAINQLHKRYL